MIFFRHGARARQQVGQGVAVVVVADRPRGAYIKAPGPMGMIKMLIVPFSLPSGPRRATISCFQFGFTFAQAGLCIKLPDR